MFTYSRMKSKIAVILVMLLLCSTWTSVFVSASPMESNFVEETAAAPDKPENEIPAPEGSEKSEQGDPEPVDVNSNEQEQEAGTDPSDSESDTETETETEVETPDSGAEEPGEDFPPTETEIVDEPEKVEETEIVEDENQDELFDVLAEVSSMEILSHSIMMNPGAAQQFEVKLYDENGQEVNVSEGLEWEADPSIGQIDDDGLFTANNIVGQVQYGYVTARYGELSAQALVLVGRVAVVIEDFEALTRNGKTVLSTGVINSNPSNVELSSRPGPVVNGEHAAMFTYDMSGTSGTSAAYVNLHDLDTGSLYRPLEGYPTKLGVWVYGDQSAHWFRARIRNASNTLVATIDFTTTSNFTWAGWKYVTATLPTNLSGPLKISDLYLVETKNDNKNAGVLYFDRLSAFYSNTDILGIDLTGLTPMQAGESKQAQVYITKNGSVAPELVQNGVTFLSSHPDVATIDSNGMVHAHRAGQTTIVALYGSGQPALFELTVTETEPPLESIEIYGPSEIEQGRTENVKVFARYANYPDSIEVTGEVQFSSSDTQIASIQAGGIVTGHSLGTATITADFGVKQARYTLQVIAPVPVLDKIELSGLKAMKIGEERQAVVTAKYTVLDQYREDLDKDVTQEAAFKSSKPEVVQISADGKVTARSVGATMITATYEGKSHSYVQVVNGETTVPKRELRAAWIATVENIDWPAKGAFDAEKQRADYIRILDELEAVGMNAIVMQIKPTADAFYPSEYAPWSKWLTGEQGKDPGYDPLAFMIEEARKRNMEFHAWFNPYRASMEPDINSLIPEHPLRQHEDWLLTYGGRLIMDPGIPETQQYIIDSIMEVVRNYDIDAVHFDDYFYPYPVAGVNFPDDASYSKYGNGMNRDDWRRHNVDTLIENLSKAIKAEKPYVQFGISPFGIWKNQSSDPAGSDTRGTESYNALYADTRKWVQEEWIDYIAPQIYWYFNYGPAAYEILIDWWSKQVEGKNVHLYIGQGAYRIGADDPNWLDPDQMPNQITFNRNFANVKGSIFFSTQSLRNNPLGFTDKLQNELYAYPALVPEMSWLGMNAPATPVNVTGVAAVSGIELNWQETQNQASYYVIYRSVGDRVPDINDSASIHRKVMRADGEKQQFIDQAIEPGKTYTYVITAVNRTHQESTPSLHVSVVANETDLIQSVEFEKLPTLYVGNTHQVKVKAIYKDRTEYLPINNEVEFASSNERVATIDHNGSIKAIAAGKTTLSVKYLSLTAEYELVVLSNNTGGGDNPGGGSGGSGPDNSSGNNSPTNSPQKTPDESKDLDGENTEGQQNMTLSDISGHWAAKFILQAIQLNFISGYGDGTFRPENKVNRDEFAVMLSRALKLQGPGMEITFADSDKIPSWARPHIARVLKSNIISGYSDHTFRPDQKISRAEMAVMMVRALGIKIDSEAALPFADADAIPTWARPYVAAAYKAGIIQGRSNQTFAPNDDATRAEAVVMILKMSQYKE